MDDALTQVLLRRERIRHRIARQRDGVTIAFAGLERPISVIDRLVDAGRVLRAHPVVLIALITGVLVLRTRSVIGLIGRGIGLWRLARRVRVLIEHFAH